MSNLRRPPSQPLVAASILAADFARMGEHCEQVLDAGADLLHLDVMDGHFVPNLTMGPDMCKALRGRCPNVYLDVHLMVTDPGRWIEPFAEAGANLLSFHVEACHPMQAGGDEPGELIRRIHHHGLQAGIVVNPDTSVESLEPWLEDVDLVLIMSVHPGRAGQSFIADVLSKAQWVAQVVDRHTRVEMDGGLNPDNAPDAVAAGVDVLVTASSLFKASDPEQVISRLHHAGTPRPTNRG